MKLSKRVHQLAPSPTLALTAKAMSMRSQGLDVISFGAGEPDFDTPDHIKQAAIQAIESGFTKYTPVGGIDELKDAIIEKFQNENGISYNRSEILVSCGGKHAIYNLAQALFQPGDEVIIPAPFWVSYPPIVELAGATPVILEASERDGFKISSERLREAITPQTKALILNSPCNPTGAAYDREELTGLAEVILQEGIYVVSDEIYEKIVFDGFRFTSMASLSSDLKNQTVIVHGMSKTYSMTGWRIGFTAGPSDLIKAMTNREVPSRGLPLDVGVVVDNVGTCFAIYQAIVKRRPLVERVVTVSGPGIRTPKNFQVRIGTLFSDVLSAVGYEPEAGDKVVMGGPMMGRAVPRLDVPVVKATSGILVFPAAMVAAHHERPCLRCGRCVAACPMGLLPGQMAALVVATILLAGLCVWIIGWE